MRYLVFAGSHYYPAGGWEDFVGRYDTLEKAKAFLTANVSEDGKWNKIYQWGHIVDAETLTIVEPTE